MRHSARIDFLVELSKRRVVERYVGTSSRVVWMVLSPLVPLLMNLAVFFYIARIPEVREMGLAAYAAFIFSGLLPFRFIQRTVTEGCDLLTGNMEMLKSAVFPLPFLGLSAVGAAVVDLLIQCGLMAILMWVAGREANWTVALLPAAFAALLALAVGACWLASVAGYLLREFQEVCNVLFGALLYITPAMYPPEAAPEFLQRLIWLNPLTHYVVMFRYALLPSAGGPHWTSWGVGFGLSAAVLAAVYAVTAKVQRYVGDIV